MYFFASFVLLMCECKLIIFIVITFSRFLVFKHYLTIYFFDMFLPLSFEVTGIIIILTSILIIHLVNDLNRFMIKLLNKLPLKNRYHNVLHNKFLSQY